MAARVPKTRCHGTLTEAGYRGFIRSLLRKGSMRWRPKSAAKMAARHHEKLPGRGGRLVYHSTCAHCGGLFPETTTEVDHVTPVVDPEIGFTSWDDFIERLFCEADQLQVLCNTCHLKKTNAEKEKAKQRRKA